MNFLLKERLFYLTLGLPMQQLHVLPNTYVIYETHVSNVLFLCPAT